jgi:hypothetical protein
LIGKKTCNEYVDRNDAFHTKGVHENTQGIFGQIMLHISNPFFSKAWKNNFLGMKGKVSLLIQKGEKWKRKWQMRLEWVRVWEGG